MSNLLQQVWKHHDLEDILNAGLDYNAITSSDIINASDIYQDPNKEYTSEELDEILEKFGLDEIIQILQNHHTVSDIVDVLDKDDVIECFTDDELIDHINDSGYIDDLKEEEYAKGYDDASEDLKESNEDITERLLNKFVDSDINHKWTILCDIFGLSYYESDKLFEKINELSNELKKSLYNNHG